MKKIIWSTLAGALMALSIGWGACVWAQTVCTNPNGCGSILSALSSNVLFSPDNTYSIGASGAGRPASVYVAGTVTANSLNVASPSSLVFGSNYQSFTPIFSGWGTMTVTNSSIVSAYYIQIGPMVHFSVDCTVTYGTASATLAQVFLPWTSTGESAVALEMYNNITNKSSAFVTGNAVLIDYPAGFTLGTVYHYMLSGTIRVS